MKHGQQLFGIVALGCMRNSISRLGGVVFAGDRNQGHMNGAIDAA